MKQTSVGDGRFPVSIDMETSDHAVIGETLDGVITAYNQAASHLYGYSPREMLGQHALRLIPPDRRDQFLAMLQEIRAGRRVEHHDTVRLHKDGTRMDVSIALSPIQDASGAVTGVSAVARHSGHGKTSEAVLERSTKQVRQIVETAQEGIWTIDIDGNSSFVNSMMAEMLGCTADEVLGHSWDDFMDEEGCAIAASNLERCRQGIREYHDFKFLRKDGSDLWALANTIPLTNAEGIYAGVLIRVTDMTERKRIEERIRLNAQVVEHMQIGLIVFRLERPDDASSLRLIVANHAAAAFTKYELDQLLGKTILDAFPALSGTGIPQIYLECAQQKSIREVGEFPYEDENLAAGIYSLKVFPLPDACVGVAYEDVTERRRVADAQAQEHERFAKGFHSSPTALAITRVADGSFLDLNEAYERLCGYRRDEVVGRLSSEFAMYANSDERSKMMRLLRDQEPIRDCAITLRSLKGELRDVLCSLEPIEVGGEACTLSSIVDITELKRTEHELRLREQRVLFLAEASAVLASALDYAKTLSSLAHLAVPSMADYCAVHVVNDDGSVRELEVAYTDKSALELARELQGRYPEIPSADRSIYRVVSTGKPELIPIVPDTLLVKVARDDEHLALLRSLRIHSLLVVPIRTRDHVQGTLTFISSEPGRYSADDIPLMEDVARRAATAIDNAHLYQEAKVAAEAMSQLNLGLEQRVAQRTGEIALANQRLSALNSELEAFSYSVSHDLRAPLRHIDGFSKALVTHYASLLDERGLHYLDLIRSGTKRMGELIDDLLELSRVTRSEVRFTAVDLSVMARQIASDLQSEDATRTVSWVIPETLPAWGDKRLLGLILNNLLGNAWKFSGKTDNARIEFSSKQIDGEMVYTVGDNGAGFDMAYVDKLFGAFERLHSHDEFEGTGVGLATVQRIVHRHGGRIWAEGAVGQGAKISFTLQAAG